MGNSEYPKNKKMWDMVGILVIQQPRSLSYHYLHAVKCQVHNTKDTDNGNGNNNSSDTGSSNNNNTDADDTDDNNNIMANPNYDTTDLNHESIGVDAVEEEEPCHINTTKKTKMKRANASWSTDVVPEDKDELPHSNEGDKVCYSNC